MKTRIFIDFWNFQLSVSDIDPNYRIDWLKVSPWLISEASKAVGQTLSYEGSQVYMSYNPGNKKDSGLRDFALNVLSRFPGVQVSLLERKARNAPVCPSCHQEINACPHCNKTMTRTIEKGVDTAIVTDMLSLAWENALNVAILVSSDRDFIPAVNMLSTKGYRLSMPIFRRKG